MKPKQTQILRYSTQVKANNGKLELLNIAATGKQTKYLTSLPTLPTLKEIAKESNSFADFTNKLDKADNIPKATFKQLLRHYGTKQSKDKKEGLRRLYIESNKII